MIECILQIFQKILPFDEFDGIFEILKEIGDLIAIDAIPFALQTADAVRTL